MTSKLPFSQVQVKIWEYCTHSACLFFILETTDPRNICGTLAACLSKDKRTDFNAWFDIKMLEKDVLEIRGSLIVPPDKTLNSFYLEVRDRDGVPVYGLDIGELSEGRDDLTAGFIAGCKLDDDSYQWTYWSNVQETPLQYMIQKKSEEETRPCGNGVYLHRVTTAPGPVELKPKIGVGQTAIPEKMASLFQGENADLKPFKDRYLGETAWLVGNGPSVNRDDLERLAGRLTFGFNRLYLAYNDMVFRPTFTVSADKQVIEDFGSEIINRSTGTVFLASPENPYLKGDYVWVKQASLYPSLFSLNPEQAVTTGGSSVYVALQLGFYMGIRKFYLYGTDFSFKIERNIFNTDIYRAAMGDSNHFIANYRSGQSWCPPDYRFITNSFWMARCLLEANGGAIKNVTHGGRLEVFERESFDNALVAEHSA